MSGERQPEDGVEVGPATGRRVWRSRRLLLLALPAAVVLVVSLLVIVNRDPSPRTSVAIGTLDPGAADTDPAPTSPISPDGTTTVTTAVAPSTRPVAARSSGSAPTPPRLVSVAADSAAGTVTLTFDQPVSSSGDGMGVVFYMTKPCDSPSANGHQLLSGSGTPTIVLASSYRWPGTAYVRVNAGLVTGTSGALPNDAVDCTAVETGAAVSTSVVGAFIDTGADPGSGAVTVLFDRPVTNGPPAALGVFDDPSCQHRVGGGVGFSSFAGSGQVARLQPATGGSVVVTTDGRSSGDTYVLAGPGLGLEANGGLGSLASTCLKATPFDPPVLLSATGDLAGGRITLHFSRPVDGTAGDTLVAMRLVVHETDSSCTSPNGNAHTYLAGMGTDTITVDATSLVAGTTYISIAPGFVHSSDGIANRGVGCYALPVS